MENINLLPCPFCNSSEIQIWHTSLDFNDKRIVFRIGCDECGLNTKYFKSQEEVIKYWNARNDGWISVDEKMPEEQDSIFANFYNTPRWDINMFRKVSNDILVIAEFEDGIQKVFVSRTHDGVMQSVSKFFKHKITHWMPFPLPIVKEDNNETNR